MRLALVLGLLLLAPLVLAAPADHRAWAGPITHDLVYKPSAEATIYRTLYGEPGCHGSGIGIVDVDLAAGSLKIVNPDNECIPGFTTLSTGCAVDADEHVRCAYDVGNVHIHADISPAGDLVFTYDDPGFNEVIRGTLSRIA